MSSETGINTFDTQEKKNIKNKLTKIDVIEFAKKKFPENIESRKKFFFGYHRTFGELDKGFINPDLYLAIGEDVIKRIGPSENLINILFLASGGAKTELFIVKYLWMHGVKIGTVILVDSIYKEKNDKIEDVLNKMKEQKIINDFLLFESYNALKQHIYKEYLDKELINNRLVINNPVKIITVQFQGSGDNESFVKLMEVVKKSDRNTKDVIYYYTTKGNNKGIVGENEQGEKIDLGNNDNVFVEVKSLSDLFPERSYSGGSIMEKYIQYKIDYSRIKIH